ncbi:5e0bc5b0-b6e7-4f5d-9499-30ae09d69305 [Sclerotinia trifoliorum]|uniref:5e0bc5b0-b6e7-4f5d-9499-30ae09d69305 n=1 Tax=Sclerotinia trifoliorum TaxID=28548 RepID=A0A8H2ZNW9_9HELO|nr:5e0bc5b0-b6e7-4f5d-9499-30ae09d69305 [Sclerotinia trifoliorum]
MLFILNIKRIRHRLYHYRSTTDLSNLKSTPKQVNIDSRFMIYFKSYFRYGPAFASIGTLKLEEDFNNCGCHAMME